MLETLRGYPEADAVGRHAVARGLAGPRPGASTAATAAVAIIAHAGRAAENRAQNIIQVRRDAVGLIEQTLFHTFFDFA